MKRTTDNRTNIELGHLAKVGKLAGLVTFEENGQRTGYLSIKIADVDGRLIVVRLDIHRDSGIDATFLRDLAITQLEATLNTPEWSKVFRENLDPHLVLEEDSMRIEYGPSVPSDTRTALRRIVRKGRQGGRWPGELYELAADVYLQGGPKPTATLADVAGIEHSTAARWVREARSRGLLPAGRKGRAG